MFTPETANIKSENSKSIKATNLNNSQLREKCQQK